MTNTHVGRSADLSVDDLGHVAVVEITRPPNNFFDTDLIGQLASELERLASDSECRAVVLCSAGKHFCAGANFNSPSAESAGENEPHLYDVALRLFEQPLPIVAAVQGAAVGGGLGLALAADFRVATSNARFTANFARLGFHHGFGLTETLPRTVGMQRANEMLYTGVRLDGAAAYEMGLCDRLVSEDALRDEAVAFAEEIASSAPLAVRSIRATMRAPLVDAVRSAVVRERAEQERLMATTDFTEGVAAVTARRTPEFTGR